MTEERDGLFKIPAFPEYWKDVEETLYRLGVVSGLIALNASLQQKNLFFEISFSLLFATAVLLIWVLYESLKESFREYNNEEDEE